MTAQIPDAIRVGPSTLSIQGVRGEGLFDAATLGMRVTMMHTACYRGFIATYGLKGAQLALEALRVRYHFADLTLPRPMMILEVRGPGADRRVEVFDSQARIGSGEDCAVRLGGEGIAEDHALIHIPGRIGVVPRAGAADAPVTVNGETITRYRVLSVGDEVGAGPHRVRLVEAEGLAVLDDVAYPILDGVAPRFDPTGYACDYEGLAIPVAFSGGLLACKGFLRELYVHMGFHPAWKFEHVEELIFEEGQLTHHEDVSEKLAEVREVMTRAPLEPGQRAAPEALKAWIARTFQLDY